MPAPILATKLYVPPPLPRAVPRSRLIAPLNEGLASGCRLSLISAPAGFGKTTLVSGWIADCKRPVAWLSLDEGDNDPTRFLAYLIAALQTIELKIGESLLAVLQSPQPPPTESILTALLNEITTVADNFILVLDDYHVIDSQRVDQALVFLVEHLPPQMHLVIATREDPQLPLSRLRVRNQLTELRAADLRFTPAEAAEFLNQIMGLNLSAENIAALEDRTEGWIAGLQLAGISVRDRANPSNFIATLSGSHRFILRYLTEEVLNRQPPEIQQFLLQTSILDKLNGEVCNAVTGRADGPLLLDRLLNANLFLISLDDEQQWFRYHHLFADLLRDRLVAQQKDQMAELHRCASRWYGQQGMASEAIRHALAAEDYALAVQLIERHAMNTVMQGYVQTVNGWMQALPPEWQSHSPRTNLALAWMHALRGAYPQAIPYLDRVEVSEKDPALEAEWLALQVFAAQHARPGHREQGTHQSGLGPRAARGSPRTEPDLFCAGGCLSVSG